MEIITGRQAGPGAVGKRRRPAVPGMVGLLLCAWSAGHMNPSLADGTVTIPVAGQQTLKGFGCFPSAMERDSTQPSQETIFKKPNTQTAVFNLGFTVARMDIPPHSGNSDTSLNTTALQDLVDQINMAKNHGVTQYILSAWSPPAYMKLPDQTTLGLSSGGIKEYLNPAYASGSGYTYADYITAVLKYLNSSGVGLPVALSIQNEPDINQNYDSCAYTLNSSTISVYSTVIKNLRAKLDAAGFTGVTIFGPEPSDISGNDILLGASSSSGYPHLNSDSTFNSALGAFSFHTYDTARLGTDRQAMNVYSKDRWMTEWSVLNIFNAGANVNSSNFLVNMALEETSHMNSDLVDAGANYWLWWKGWQVSSSPGYEQLVYGSGDSPQYTKEYYVLKTLWNIVRPGWAVKKLSTTDPDLKANNDDILSLSNTSGRDSYLRVDAIAFDSGTQTVVVLTNRTSSDKLLTVTGLHGSSATVYRTSAAEDMAPVGTPTISNGSATVSLPAYSVVVMATSGTGGTSGPTPFSGAAVTVAASGTSTVEAENYDKGGEGIAYHQTAVGVYNGTNYRSDNNTAVYPDGSASNGWAVGWASGGQWLGYTVSVAAAGKYDITAGVSSAANGGTFHLEDGPVGQIGGLGTTNLGAFTVPATGNWTGSYVPVSLKGVSLPAGTQWLRLVDDTDGYNVDKFSLTPSGTAGSALPRSGWSGWGASVASGSAGLAWDGSTSTRWTTGAAQTGNDYFQVSLGASQTFSKILLDAGNGTDYPRNYYVNFSSDCSNWTGQVTGSGAAQTTAITFPAVTTKFIRIHLTTNGASPWSIAEMNLY